MLRAYLLDRFLMDAKTEMQLCGQRCVEFLNFLGVHNPEIWVLRVATTTVTKTLLKNTNSRYLSYFVISPNFCTCTTGHNYPRTKLLGTASKLRGKRKVTFFFVHVVYKT